jgi:flagellar hook-associated protein 1 FlgK
MSTFSSLNTIRSGLFGSQRALETVGKNIANANVKGYHRQEVLFAAAEPNHVINGIGRGLNSAQVVRYRDEFLDRQFRARSGWSGYYSTQAEALSQIENLVGDLGDNGLKASLENFWNSWKTLALHPNDLSMKQGVVWAAQTFLQEAKSTFTGLQDLRTNLDEQLQAKVTLVNQAAAELASLNKSIQVAQGSGQEAHELADRRDQLVDSLAQLAGASAVTQPDGTVTVYITSLSTTAPATSGSFVLVQGATAMTMTATQVMEADLDPSATVTSTTQLVTNLTYNGTPTPWNVPSGEIGALLEARDQIAPSFMQRLDDLVRGIANQVNNLHGSAVDPAMPDFFTVGATWMTIDVNPVLTADPSQVWAAGALPGAAPVPPPVVPWPPADDGVRAQQIGALADSAFLTMGTQSMTARDFLRGLSTEIGFAVKDATARADAAALQVDQAQQQRDSVSGVSIDEEMTKMIQYQQSYNAAARVMTAVDEMLDILINRVGLAGR